jgi:hypothetical protein
MSCRSWAFTAKGGGDMAGEWVVLSWTAPGEGGVEKDFDVR